MDMPPAAVEATPRSGRELLARFTDLSVRADRAGRAALMQAFSRATYQLGLAQRDTLSLTDSEVAECWRVFQELLHPELDQGADAPHT